MRRGKTDRVPKTRAGGQWSECAFFAFIRSGLRQLSMRWPPIANAMKAARQPYDGPNKRLRWVYKCATCGRLSPAAESVPGKKRRKKLVHVDHIEPCGKLSSFEDASGFLRRLLVEADGLRVLCHACHALRTAKTMDDEEPVDNEKTTK